MMSPILSFQSNFRSDTQMGHRRLVGVEAVVDEGPGVADLDSMELPRIPIPPYGQRLPWERAD